MRFEEHGDQSMAQVFILLQTSNCLNPDSCSLYPILYNQNRLKMEGSHVPKLFDEEKRQITHIN